jgi:hypothetical protein
MIQQYQKQLELAEVRVGHYHIGMARHVRLHPLNALNHKILTIQGIYRSLVQFMTLALICFRFAYSTGRKSARRRKNGVTLRRCSGFAALPMLLIMLLFAATLNCLIAQ